MRLWVLLAVAGILARSASAQGTSLNVRTGGHGEPQLIFLLAPNGPGEAWDHVVARFEVGYRCHLVTPGGWTDRSLEALADAVIAYVREQGLVRPVLIGQDAGGAAVLKVALRAPDLPGRLVLVDSRPSLAKAGFPAADLGRVRCPTVVLGALAGRGASARRDYRRQYRELPGVRFVFFGQTRRFLTMEDLDGFTDALRRELVGRR